MPKRVNPPGQSRRDKSAVTTVEIDIALRKDYKRAAVELDTTMRELVEEAMRAYWSTIEKRVRKAK